MINKQSIWFLTLFVLVLILGVYYITMPSDIVQSMNNVDVTDNSSITVSENDVLAALRVEHDEETLTAMQELEETLTSENATAEEKNSAFEELKILNLAKGKEKSLEEKIQNEFNVKSFVKIDGDQIYVTINSKEHSYNLANNIMRTIQNEYENKVYVTVKFE